MVEVESMDEKVQVKYEHLVSWFEEIKPGEVVEVALSPHFETIKSILNDLKESVSYWKDWLTRSVSEKETEINEQGIIDEDTENEINE